MKTLTKIVGGIAGVAVLAASLGAYKVHSDFKKLYSQMDNLTFFSEVVHEKNPGAIVGEVYESAANSAIDYAEESEN
ncbi:hypothetical protein CMI38_00580 [Candidatus Pacearchaeota archaeon]|nr:hypothetical protein [Candidatus Pacearchaeota archaeon]|tara:strand:+ start:900 stop:1130 length:231 start_codon:yes stop_codon:yes gene_type:complete